MSQTIEKTVDTPIQITREAINELKRIMGEQQIPAGHGLRVGVKGGGCSGFSYILGFDISRENDQQFDVHGLDVYIQSSHALYLIGMEIDYVNGLNNRGFTFTNPNASSTCGCGSSFNA